MIAAARSSLRTAMALLGSSPASLPARPRTGEPAPVATPAPDSPATEFRRELGPLDAAVVVAGAIIGVGIFANPATVARLVGDPLGVLVAWTVGGALALLGGFAYAELAARWPVVGGQYVYLARAYHPIVGFLYGVALLFIINGGAIAAVAVLVGETVDGSFVRLGAVGVRIVAAAVLIALTAINTLGIRAGKRTNNLLMAAKVGGILAVVALAFLGTPRAANTFATGALVAAGPVRGLGLLLTALVPIMFAYGGWQNCGSIAAEIRDPARNLARANVAGVALVIVLYLALNLAYLRVLPIASIAGSHALAADVARAVAGEAGARFVAALVLVSALGFLAVIVLTGPRLYYAMARDGLFFRRAGELHPRFRTPVATLWLQTAIAIALLISNSYDQLLSYVVFADWLFFGLTVGALFVFRRRDAPAPAFAAMPGHPYTTALFVLAAAGIVLNSYVAYPAQSLIGSAILLLAAGAYWPATRRRGASR